MQTAANTNRFSMGLSSKAVLGDSEIMVNRGGLLHVVSSRLAQAIHSQEPFVNFANELIRLAEQAYMLRALDVLDEMSQVLMNLPITGTRQIGLYYAALSMKRKGEIDEAQPLLEAVADNAPITYRARAVQSLGTNYHTKCQHADALKLQLEALRMASERSAQSQQISLLARLEISHIKSDMGDHRGALETLEALSPLVQIVGREKPLYFYFYHNELAVEFAELKQLAEAEAACAVATASPFAHAYPEWIATRDEIAAKRTAASPSIVAVQRVSKPAASPLANPQCESKPVIRFAFRSPSSNRDFFQRSIIPIPARTTIVLNAVSTRDRVLTCIGPRAPPSFL